MFQLLNQYVHSLFLQLSVKSSFGLQSHPQCRSRFKKQGENRRNDAFSILNIILVMEYLQCLHKNQWLPTLNNLKAFV